MSMNESMLRRFRSPGDATAFSAGGTLKRIYPFLTRSQIEHELSKVDSFTLFKKTAKPKTNPMYIHDRRLLMEIDLVDISSLKQWNDGITFLLVLIDCFSRYVCVEPLTNKTGISVARALANIFDSRLPPPIGRTYRFDRGTEFLNSHVKQLLQSKNIQFTHPTNKPHHVERVNRTIQNIIYQYLEEHETKRYIDQLQNIVKSYNTRPHRIIRMSPIEADLPTNRLLVRKALAYTIIKEKKIWDERKSGRNMSSIRLCELKPSEVFSPGAMTHYLNMKYSELKL